LFFCSVEFSSNIHSFFYLSFSPSSPFLLFLSLILRGKENTKEEQYYFSIIFFVFPFLGETKKIQKKKEEPWIHRWFPTTMLLLGLLRSQWLTRFWLRLFRILAIV